MGSLVRLPGQYEGLKAAEGVLKPKPLAHEIPVPEVEQRPLAMYEKLVEVGSC